MNQIYVNGLSPKETELLLKEYAQTKQEILKEKLILGNMRLVLSIVKRFQNRNANYEDLLQVGMIGLIKSIQNFNPNYNLQLSTYAVPLIIGEIKKYLRDNTSIRITRSLKDLSYQILLTNEKALKELQRPYSTLELAKIFKTSPYHIEEAMLSTYSIQSIDESIKNKEGTNTSLVDIYIKQEPLSLNSKIDLQQAIKMLSPKESFVITKHYYDGLTQIEIAEELSVSQAQVSRVEKSALKKMHDYLCES